MEASGTDPDAYRGTSGMSGNSRRYGMFSASNIIQAPISTLLEYSGLLRTRPNHQESQSLISGGVSSSHINNHNRLEDLTLNSTNNGEVSIRIIGAGEHEHEREGSAGLVVGQPRDVSGQSETPSVSLESENQGEGRSGRGVVNGEGASQSSNGNGDAETGDGAGVNGRDSSYQRYDIQQAARWIEQVLPFSLLLLVVFIRQHLQGFFVTIWIAAVMFKSNDILRKQTALKGERKVSVLIGISIAFILHVLGVYWWFRNDDLLYPLIMLPPKSMPPFWHAIFIIMVNDTLVRQAAMVSKCFLLMYYKNSRGRNYRKQGQLLTLVEYLILLYRALLPTPVWYRFFLNKEYGSLFSSLMTGLYLTFKLTSVVEKVQSFFTALKALSRKEVHYGAYATSEQVNAAGDLCAICQEKMHAPILLRCKHIFCEDCVSEWFERERTCPLCRALVKPAELRSFGDGSTSLFFQIF
ncbi:RING finger and transmembrane domain-containing protein 2-like [Mangifera indica]|uniref:RING finger and transmembrane domain-containing protein 2-like n=1 Tax=Mangifera indica TaxID=29780 RepID=UPI001CFB6F00|nr:RING finger and transmembrane domain-containing protein 2-like [Mangifera indica]XP_044508625.1 RING finger and transmembrane domain-containing protein 2-like [Mangifera indica]